MRGIHIRSLITHRDERIHIEELRQFVHEGNEQALYSVALRDHQDRYFIDSVTDYHGSLDRRRDLKFKVHWTGYDAGADSWVSYSELRDTAALHKYLLPKNFNYSSLLNSSRKESMHLIPINGISLLTLVSEPSTGMHFVIYFFLCVSMRIFHPVYFFDLFCIVFFKGWFLVSKSLT